MQELNVILVPLKGYTDLGINQKGDMEILL